MIVENISVLIFLIVIVILGIINAAYLVISNYRKKPIVCPINHECNELIQGKWSRIFYVRNDFLGLLFYIFFEGVLIPMFLICTKDDDDLLVIPVKLL